MTTVNLPTTGDRFGRYIVDGEIAKGGFSVVLKARRDDGTLVALKLLAPQDESVKYSDNLKERFAREARLLTQIKSPFTVQLFEYGADPQTGLLYMAFELVQGLSLFELIKQQGPQSPTRMLAILKQCVLGLNRAHEVGILHRDIKPNNIMLFDDGIGGDRVKVIDFGIAKRLGEAAQDLTTAGTLVGTPRYMSPEQIRCQELGPTSDIYSLGLCMVELLTARKAVWGKSRTDVITRQLDVSQQVPVPDDLPPAIRHIVGKMVAKIPQARYQNGNEVLAEIERYNQGTAELREGDTLYQSVDEDSLNSLISDLKQPPEDKTVLQSVRIDAFDIPQQHAAPGDQTVLSSDLDRTVASGFHNLQDRQRHDSSQNLPMVPDDSRNWVANHSDGHQSTPSSQRIVSQVQNPSASFNGPMPQRNPSGSYNGPMPQNPSGSFNGPMPQNPSASFNGPMPQNPSASFNGPMPQNPHYPQNGAQHASEFPVHADEGGNDVVPLIASFFIPGSGHIMSGYKAKGGLLIASWVMFLLLSVMFMTGEKGLIDYLLGFVSTVVLLVVIGGGLLDLWLTRRAAKHREVKPLEFLPDLSEVLERLK